MRQFQFYKKALFPNIFIYPFVIFGLIYSGLALLILIDKGELLKDGAILPIILVIILCLCSLFAFFRVQTRLLTDECLFVKEYSFFWITIKKITKAYGQPAEFLIKEYEAYRALKRNMADNYIRATWLYYVDGNKRHALSHFKSPSSFYLKEIIAPLKVHAVNIVMDCNNN